MAVLRNHWRKFTYVSRNALILIIYTSAMFNHPFDVENRAGETEETKNFSKTQLYKYVGIDKVLPSIEARCSTRAYLLRVLRREAYSIRREELLMFEATLQEDEMEKTPFFNMSLLKERLDALLQFQEKPTLNLPEGTLMDESTFSRILRFEDRANILRGFKKAVRNCELPRIIPGRVYSYC